MTTSKDDVAAFKKNVLKKFGEHIIQLRKSQNLTSAELARRSDFTASNMSRLEMGKSNPTLISLIKLANAFSVTLEGLLKGFNFGRPRFF